MTRRIKDFSEIKKGMKFMVVDNSNSNNYPINKILTARIDGVKGAQYMNNFAVEYVGNNVYLQSVVLAPHTVLEIKTDLQNVIKELREKEEELNNLQDLCEEMGLKDKDTIDQNMVIVWNVLKALNKSQTRLEQAKTIAKIISEW